MSTTKDGAYVNNWAEVTRAYACPLCDTKAGEDCDETCPEFWNE